MHYSLSKPVRPVDSPRVRAQDTIEDRSVRSVSTIVDTAGLPAAVSSSRSRSTAKSDTDLDDNSAFVYEQMAEMTAGLDRSEDR